MLGLDVEEQLIMDLTEFGLTRNQAKTYLALLKLGHGRASEIARTAGIERTGIYRELNALHKMGLISISLTKPATFTPIPPEEALRNLSANLEERLRCLRQKENALISRLRDLDGTLKGKRSFSFNMILGGHGVRNKFINLIRKAANEVLLIASSKALPRMLYEGIAQGLKASMRKGVDVKLISEVTPLNVKVAEYFARFTSFRHVEQLHTPTMLVLDGKQVLIELLTESAGPTSKVNRACLWSDDENLISIVKKFFDLLWHESLKANEVIKALKSGLAIEEFKVLKERAAILNKIREMSLRAKYEASILTTANVLRTGRDILWQINKDMSRKGVKVRVLSFIDEFNYQEAKELNRYFEVRHSPTIPVFGMCIIDCREAILVNWRPDDLSVAKANDVCFYTTIKESVHGFKAIYEALWSQSIPLSERMKELEVKLRH